MEGGCCCTVMLGGVVVVEVVIVLLLLLRHELHTATDQKGASSTRSVSTAASRLESSETY